MRRFFLVLTAVLLLTANIFAQAAPSQIRKVSLSQAEIDHIIKKFTDKEFEYRQALKLYSFKRDAVIQSLGFGGQVTGEYNRKSTFTFDDAGKKYEKITYFPMPTIKAQVTAEDLEDLGGVNPFALEPSKIDQYSFTLIGKEKIDELDLYVFDVAPKVMPEPKKGIRLFQGRIWVDDQDLQIVKSKGKGVPEWKNNKFPIVETWRENVDGKYWFPSYSYANDELIFENGSVLRLKMRVKYTDYKEANVKVIIKDIDEPEETKPEETKKPEVKPTPPPQR